MNGEPYYGLFSGGKDSVVTKHLAKMAGVPVVWNYNITTIDPPELVHFIKREHPDVVRIPPEYGNFFNRMEKKGFPTRINRWCCAEYKEGQSPKDAKLLMGIRGQESPRRAARWSLVQTHFSTKQKVVNPIYKWDASDLWDFILAEKIPYCSLYDEGFKRLGCVGCPNSNKEKEFLRWPRFARLYRRSFNRIWERRIGTYLKDGRPWFGGVYFHSADEMFEWWCSKKSLPEKIGGVT